MSASPLNLTGEIDMNIDIQAIPFSRYGSYIAFSRLPSVKGREEGVYLRTIRGPADLNPNPFQAIFRIELLQEGELVPYKEIASPTLLRLEADGGYAEICIPEPSVVRIRSAGVGVRLSRDTASYDNAIPRGEGRWQVSVSGAGEVKYMLTALEGQLSVDAPWRVIRSERIIVDLTPDATSGVGECAIEEFNTVWQEREYDDTFEACQRNLEQEYADWRAKMQDVPVAYAEAAETAAYINWSCVVAPSGHLTRPAMYMSKSRMVGIWSWDNCFNAIALSHSHPRLAWDQFMITFDNQHASGALPDVLDDQLGVWGFNKPPVQGWTLRQMMRRTDYIDRDKLEEAYEPLCRWTDWWFTYRDDDGDGIPQYNHGNDSGWDNCTVFNTLPPIESPDLSAYLVIQMDVLAEMAQALGRDDEARQWKTRADGLLRKMLDHFWKGDRFVALRAGSHEVIESESLFLFLPIVLGKRLHEDVRSRLVAGLKAENRFLTEHGLATESVSSPLYQPHGYWRGPIWGAPTMLIADGLDGVGERAFARDLRRRFCNMVAQNGIAENYDAITGEGLCERGFTWTASIFLSLAHELVEREKVKF